MDGFKPCPTCYTDIDVVAVPKTEVEGMSNFFFVNCKACGDGSKEAFDSVSKLKAVWNEFVLRQKFN